jgi:16S rRNA (cytosine967-C5)-methyltransferase
MRVNALKADRARVEKALARHGAAPTRYAPLGLRIAATSGEGRHPNVQAEAAFHKGWFEVQDEGSQIAAAAVLAGRGGQVLDVCAGAGGKTLALAAAMANKGQLFATDRDPMRLAPIYERLKRAGTRNVQVRDPDAPLAPLAGRMDAVLVDAPCTGTGVWRRRPDAKWRLSERSLAERVAEQDAVLDEAARCVAPGGTLVYVTCSLLPEENGDRVAAFQARTPGFAIIPPGEVIAAAGVAPALAEAALLTDRGFILSPRRTGTDGFFVASMRRQ